MKSILLLSFICSAHLAIAQGIKKYDIGNSGCKAYFFCNPGEAKIEYSPDSSTIYLQECENDQLHYGLICVKYAASIAPVADAEDLMIQYLNYLKDEFKITASAGYGKGHTMSKNDKAKGVIDYWKDEAGSEWKIKAWTDGYYIGFMYVYTDKDPVPSNDSKIDVFLNGFRFPGM